MKNQLIRGLGLIDSTAIVIGTIIGTGVFLKTATMTQYMGSAFWVLLVWVIAGLLSFTGALSYAELGAMMPDAGGEYVYLRKGFGKFWAFLYGWMRFWIGGPGSIAAYSVGAATFLAAAVDLSFFGGKVGVALIVIVFFTLLNCLAITFGGKVQSFLTGLKLIMIVGLTMGIFILAQKVPGSLSIISSTDSSVGLSFPGVSAFGSAMLAALWAYDGWNNLPMVAGEISNPQKNIPRSLAIGMIVVFLIYAAVNVSYFYAVPISEIITSNSNLYPDALPVATKAVMSFMGLSGVVVLSLAFVVSALGSMNSSILTSARVPFAMARDGLFFKKIANISEKTSVPVISVLVQGAVSIVLALSGTFDQLTDYVVFSGWIFYAMVTGVVFVLRRREPNAIRPYKTWGYPVVPAIFIIVAIFLLGNTVYTNPIGTGIGLLMLLSGIPVFWYFNKVNPQ